jgi:hypothetical protein
VPKSHERHTVLVNASIHCCNVERKHLQSHVYMKVFSCFDSWRSLTKFGCTFQILSVQDASFKYILQNTLKLK